MSTRMTIDYGEGYHLYAECLENHCVYLKIDGAEWVESYGSEFTRKECERKGLAAPPPQMVLRIPRGIAEQLFQFDLPVWGEGGMPLRDVQVKI